MKQKKLCAFNFSQFPSTMKWHKLAIITAMVAIIFQSDLFLFICFEIWLLEDVFSHYLGMPNGCLFGLRNIAFDLYDYYYSPFNRKTVKQPMELFMINSDDYKSYEELKHITNNFKTPTVIRGLFKNSVAMNWNHTYLNDSIGDETCEVLLSHSNYFEMDRECKLYSDILTNISKNGWNYVSGDQNVLFNGSNHLIQDLQFNDILGDEYIKSNDFLLSELYLFIGNKNGGTSWHSAPNRSMFVLLKGMKKWLFIDPKYGIYLKPQRSQLYSRILLSFGKFIQNTKYVNHFENAENLYRHIPHYQVMLYPGDAITVPSWWWHHVSNIATSNENADELNIGIDIDTKTWNHDYLRSIFPRFF